VLGYVRNHVFAAARPEGQDGGLGQEVSLRRALEAALPALDQSFTDQPLVEAQIRVTLGTSFRDSGDSKTASEQFRRARQIYTQQLGPDDPTTLTSQHDLANTYADLSDFTNALKLREETLAQRRAVLGPHHRDTLTSMRAVADSLDSCERFAESVKLAEEALALQKVYLAPDDVEILRSVNNLAITYHDVDRNEESLKLYQEALERAKAIFGPYDQRTLVAMSNVATGYTNLCRYEEGLALHKEALALQIAKLGEKHRYTLRTMQQLANDYGFLKRYDEAVRYRRQVFTLLREKFGPDNYDTLMAMWGLAHNLEGLKKGEEAMPILDECFQRIARLPVQPNVIKLLDVRMRHFAKKQDAAGCRKTAEMWESLHRKDATSLYGAARYRAVTATMTRTHARTGSAGKEADVEAARAMAWLKQAVAAGYTDAAQVCFDSDLDVLRNRQDYRYLIAGLLAHK
jgi:tetratricopeptide (TPR) repeat protein